MASQTLSTTLDAQGNGQVTFTPDAAGKYVFLPSPATHRRSEEASPCPPPGQSLRPPPVRCDGCGDVRGQLHYLDLTGELLCGACIKSRRAAVIAGRPKGRCQGCTCQVCRPNLEELETK